MKSKNSRKKLGQNTAEYILLLLLIGGGAVIGFKAFGKGIINRFASISNIITGNEAVDKTKADQRSLEDKKVDFGTFDSEGVITN